MAGKPFKILLLMFLVIIIGGCSDPLDDSINLMKEQNKSKLDHLGQELNSNRIRNAVILTQYGETITRSRPQLATLVSQLVTDGTTEGAIYRGLERRVQEATNVNNFISKEEQNQELKNLNQALDPILFNDALSDVVNVLADLSKGDLARVNAMSQVQSQQANQSEDFGAGSQLVGNPSYGNWSNNNGLSFWEWYGVYALFSNLSSPISFDRWGRHRGYSYYNDYGRYRYSSPKQRKKQSDTWKRTTKKFSTGQRYSSPYSTSRVGSSRLSRQSSQAKVAAGKSFTNPNRFKSTVSKSSYSNSSSFRNSSSTTSRGTRRGK